MTNKIKYIIETKNLQKKYDENIILDKVNLQIPTGSIFGLLWPNWAWKSTLLKIISRIIKKNEWEVYFLWEKMTNKHLEDLWVLIDHPMLYENSTWYQNMEIFSCLSKNKSKNFDEILDLVGLDKKARTKKVKKYSLWMKQRLAIWIALIWNPKFLILDEPLNWIDIEWVIEFREILKKIQAKWITIVVSSHILSEIQKTCEYIGIIHSGTLKFQGKKEELLKDTHDMEESYLQIVK